MGPDRQSKRAARQIGQAIGTEYPISSVNLARFICPSFFRPDSNSIWRYAVAGHSYVRMQVSMRFKGLALNHETFLRLYREVRPRRMNTASFM